MEILVGLLFLIGIITLIGHGIWVVLAMIFRPIFGSSEEEKKVLDLSSRCSECNASLQIGDEFCAACGRWQKGNDKAGPLADLAMTARQMDRFLNHGKIDLATHKSVAKAIEEERARLTQPTKPSAVVKQEMTPAKETVIEKAAPSPVVVPQATPALIETVTASSRAESASQNQPKKIAAEPVQDFSPPEPRRSFTEMLETFMEESSIRWGELIGGLLIIGCSLALVISLWAQITAVPLIKFSVFTGITTGLFGMGFYSAHRWKLPTTSRGALMISTLLAPLNFLAMVAFSQTTTPNSSLIIAGELFALGLFLFLVYQAGKVLTPGNSWLLAGAALLPSLAMLMAKHWQGERAAILWLGVVPMLCYWGSALAILRNAEEEDEPQEQRVYTLLGVASFATALPIGLMLIKSGNLANSLHQFAPIVSLLGVPAIACGLTLKLAAQRRPSGSSGKAKTIATSIAIIGMLLATAGLVLAWPQPSMVIGVALILWGICAAAAWRFDLKLAHAAAIAFFVLAYLIGCNLQFGDYPSWSEDGARLFASFVTRTSGLAWLSLFVIFGSLAVVWRRWGRKPEAYLHEFAAICSAFFSLVLLTWHGFGRAGDPQYLTLVYVFYAATSLIVAWYRDWFIASWIGFGLSLLVIVQAVVFRFGYAMAPHHPVRLSLLIYASLATITAAVTATVLSKTSRKAQRIFAKPSTTAATIVSIAASPFVLFGRWMSVGQMSSRMFWLAAIWLVLSLINFWPVMFTAFQMALTAGVVCGVAAIVDQRFLPSHSVWFDPVSLQAQGIALVLLSLSWIALRLTVHKFESGRPATVSEPLIDGSIPAGISNWQRLLSPSWPTVDRVATAMVWGVLVLLCLGSVGDGVIKEMIPVESSQTVANQFAARARGFGSWLLLLGLAIVFITSLWEGFKKRFVIGVMTLVACAGLLVAARWQPEQAVLSPLRWALAIGFVLAALPIVFRKAVWQISERFNWPGITERVVGLADLSRTASLMLFALPVWLLTIVSFLIAPQGQIATLVERALFLAPLLIVSLTLGIYAIRERSSAYAFSSGLMLNLAATLGYLFETDVKLVMAIQANLIVSAAFSMVWFGVWKRLAKRAPETSQTPSAILRTQIMFTLCASLALLAFAPLRLLVAPEVQSATVALLGNGWSWLAVSLPAIAWASLRDWRVEKLQVNQFGLAALSVVTLVVCSLSRLTDGWTAYHYLMIGAAILSWLMLVLRWSGKSIFNQSVPLQVQAKDTSIEWATCLGLLQLVLTVRGLEAPNDAWWTAGSCAVLCLLFVGLAIVTKRRGYVYLSGVLCNLIATRIFLANVRLLDGLEAFCLVNVVVLSLTSLLWLKLDLAVMPREEKASFVPFHRFAAVASLIVVVCIAGGEWFESLGASDVSLSWLNWTALASVSALLVTCLWDAETRWSLRGLYVVGLVIGCKLGVAADFSKYQLLVATASFFSVYALTTSLLWRKREHLFRIADSLRMPHQADASERVWHWLVRANIALAGFGIFSSIVTVFNADSLRLRLIMMTAAFALPAAFALLIRGSQDQRLITNCLRLSLLNTLLWSWAWLEPGAEGQLMNRLVITMLIAETVLIVYRLIVIRQVPAESLWRQSLRADLPLIAIVGLSALALVLLVELSNYATFGAAMLSWSVITAVLLTLVGLAVIGLAFAVLPGEDPFNLDERKRMRYVYATEGVVVLTLMHLRVAMPWLFSGRFSPYWPLIVMALAFLGIGLSELFRRQGKLVLAEPLERTGVVLPLLPVVGFWGIGSQVPYSGLLLVIGLFYGWMSVRRHSFAFGLLAALAANCGLWHFLHRSDGFSFYEHPQLWLIPAALSVLLAARINRNSLSQEQTSSIRYAALITIYVSSTADIFLNGVDDSPWLPIVLAVLSVGGVIAGLMLRVRSFLFLGTAFLLLSTLTMIWSASINLGWTWLWSVMGIALGVLIIFTFAIFERKREEMLSFVQGLKRWQ